MNSNLLADKKSIKSSLIKQAARIWGTTDVSQMDPIVKLMLDAISYELSKVGQSITSSNNKVLEKLADMIVPGDAMLARPSHAVARSQPIDSSVKLTKETQFYIPNGLQSTSKGKIIGDIYFTPIKNVDLFNGDVKWQLHYKLAYSFDQEGRKAKISRISGQSPIPDNEIWIAIEVHEMPQEISSLEFYLDFEKWDGINEVLRFNSQIGAEIYFPNRKNLSLTNSKSEKKNSRNTFLEINSENKHFDKIEKNYQNRFINFFSEDSDSIKIKEENLVNLPETIKEKLDEAEKQAFSTPCLWIKLSFPPIFNRKILKGLIPRINSFVLINRKINRLQHNLKKSGTIIPIRLLEGEKLLSVDRIVGQNPPPYQLLPNATVNSWNSGSYSNHYGFLDSSDEKKGLLILEQVIQRIREEGNSFTSLGMESTLNDLSGIYDKLAELEKKIDRKKRSINSDLNSYIQLNPANGENWVEYEFSTTNAVYGNDLESGYELQQYRSNNSLLPGSIQLITKTIGGRNRIDESGKISKLRHLVLSKERIVSKSDIRQFVFSEIGDLLDEVVLKDGVHIHTDPRKGLIRTTEIHLKPLPDSRFSENEWQIICEGLRQQLLEKSTIRQHYKVVVDK